MFLHRTDKTALVLNDTKVSHNQLIENINKVSTLFSTDKGERIAIFAENSFEWIYTYYAIWQKSAIPVPIDYLSTAEEVAYILNDCRPEVLFHSEVTKERVDKLSSLINYEPKFINIDNFELGKIDNHADELIPEYDLEDTAVIIYTSGTTGQPKGVELSYKNLIKNINAVTVETVIYNKEDKVLAFLPFHHILPLLGAIILPIAIESRSVLVASLAAEDIIRALQDNKITMIIGVPRFYEMIRKGIIDKINASAVARLLFSASKRADSLKFGRKVFKKVQDKFGGSMRYMICGGASLDPNVLIDFKALGFEILEGFGMTEAAPMITFTRPNEGRPGCAGRPLNGVQVKSVDGEIVAKGDNIMKGYYNKPEDTAEVLKDGWMHTGDLGTLDDGGYIYITGRKKEIIVLSNGKNVNPVEIEFSLQNKSGAIKEIGVFNVGDKLQALIYPDKVKVNELEIADTQKYFEKIVGEFNSTVSTYKNISRIHLIDEELPKTRILKLQRFKLAEIAENLYKKEVALVEPEYEEYKILREYISKLKNVTVSPNDHLEYDLSFDSLDKVNLIVFLHSTFGIEMENEDLNKFEAVEKLAEHIKTNKTKQEIESVNWAKILKEKLDIHLPKSWFTQTLIIKTIKPFVHLYFRIKGDGLNNLPEGPCIIAPNHQSFLDGLYVSMFLKHKHLKETLYYAKEKHIRQKWLKFIANRHNVIIMDVNKDLKSSIQKMAAALHKGKNIMIFPEGTRSRDGKLGSFKQTFAILSRELNVPVVPVAIKGAFDAMPRGKKIPRPLKKISVKFLEPIHPENLPLETIKDKVYNKVLAQVGE